MTFLHVMHSDGSGGSATLSVTESSQGVGAVMLKQCALWDGPAS